MKKYICNNAKSNNFLRQPQNFPYATTQRPFCKVILLNTGMITSFTANSKKYNL